MMERVVLTRFALPGPDGVKGTKPAPSFVFEPVMSGCTCLVSILFKHCYNQGTVGEIDSPAEQGDHEQGGLCSW